MRWIELTVLTTEQGLDAVCGRLDMLGVSEVVIEEDRASIAAFLKENARYWDFAETDELVASEQPAVKAYLEDTQQNREKLDEIERSFAALRCMDTRLDLGSLQIIVRTTENEDWENNWRAYYKPMEIGTRLLVRPSWEEADANGRIVLSLDPGMAFGTGSHQTTRMCLQYLEENVKTGDKLIDLGCGSGILAIAGLLLGADDALAVDIDEIAEKIVYENAALNGIGRDRLLVRIGDALTDGAFADGLCEKRYDVVVMNIVADVVIAMSSLVPKLIKPDGVFIMSGIIADRLEDVKAGIAKNGFEVLSTRAEGDWRAILARCAR